MEPTRAPNLSAHPDPGLNLSHRLSEAIDAAWATIGADSGLFPELAFDAAWARATTGELAEATPRLLELTVTAQATVTEAVELVGALGAHPWPPDGRAVVEAVLDAWWLETLLLDPGSHRPPFAPAAVLGVVASYDAPMIRWLGPWLIELDGPGASHLAEIVIAGTGDGGLAGPAWDGKADRASQVLGWARTEAVINGLTVIGGVHLDPDTLSAALDRLI